MRSSSLLSIKAFVASVVAVSWLLNASARTIPVESASRFASACAEARPGDVLELASGEWKDATLRFAANGEEEKPIVLAAAEPGKLRLTGHSTLTFAGKHLVVRGLVFTDGFLAKGASAVVAFGDKAAEASDCRLTDCAIVRYNPPDREVGYPWVLVHGVRQRIDHCRFEGQDHFGVTLQVVVGAGDNRHLIDHNYFLNRPRGRTNGFESLQLGQAADSHRDSRSTVEYNLFEACDGEQEIISNKSGANLYRKNTFRRSAGALTLRHGDGCTVEANVFLGENKPHTGGVRVIGRHHVVRGNYFHGLSGLPTAGGIIAIYAGIPHSVPTGYVEAEGAIVEDNVLAANAGNGINLSGGYLSRGRTILPHNVTLARNWIDQHPQFGGTVLTGTPGEGLTCVGNVYTPHSEIGYGPAAGFKGLWFKGDPDAAFPIAAELAPPDTTENDGWRATMAALEPLTPAQVGPVWWQR